MDGLGAALGRMTENAGEQDSGEPPAKHEKSKGSKGHSFHVHRHKDGKHHLTVHGEHGQLTHHSEHTSLQEAANEMAQHGEGGGEAEGI